MNLDFPLFSSRSRPAVLYAIPEDARQKLQKYLRKVLNHIDSVRALPQGTAHLLGRVQMYNPEILKKEKNWIVYFSYAQELYSLDSISYSLNILYPICQKHFEKKPFLKSGLEVKKTNSAKCKEEGKLHMIYYNFGNALEKEFKQMDPVWRREIATRIATDNQKIYYKAERSIHKLLNEAYKLGCRDLVYFKILKYLGGSPKKPTLFQLRKVHKERENQRWLKNLVT